MTKSWVGLFLAAGVLGCDAGTAGVPRASGGSSGASGSDGGTTGGKGGVSDAGAPPAPGHITLTNTTPAGGAKLLWVGFNDGDEPWQTVEGAGNVYAFRVKGKRYGLAFVCEAARGSSGEVVHATTAELSSLTVDCRVVVTSPPTVRSIYGKLTGLEPDEDVFLQFGGETGSHELVRGRPPPGQMYFGVVPPGAFDLAAFAQVGGRPTRAVIRRDLFAAEGTVIVDLDFTTEGVRLIDQPLTLLEHQGGPVVDPSREVILRTGRARFQAVDVARRPVNSYRGFPATALRAGEAQSLEVLVMDQPTPLTTYRGVSRGFRDPHPLELTMPPPFSSPQVSLPPGAGNVRPHLTFEAYPGALHYQLSFGHEVSGRSTTWLVIVSAAWLGGATSYDFPDFSGAAGFDGAFVFDRRGSFDFYCDAVTSTRGFDRTINEDPASNDGAQSTYARNVQRIDIP